jgi:crotonobetainyl-CoA:carnitine CoA-transferase CaiB-like acyl-CoA transferase
MGLIRRHIRTWTALWALAQCATLAAFVPRDCCAAHRSHAADTGAHPHDETTSGAHCPMRGPGGRPCPMHRAPAPFAHAHASHDEAPPASEPHCALRGSCNGPLAALAALLSDHGITSDVMTVAPNPNTGPRLPLATDAALAAATVPDTPPPRG